MKIPRTAIGGGLAIAVAVSLIGCTTEPTEPDEPTSISIALPAWGIGGAWSSGTATMWSVANHAVYESLITWDDDKGEYAPGLAKEYEISADGLRMSVTLHEGVVFSDGTPMDAAGVVKSLNAAWGEGGAFSYLATVAEPEATVTGDYSFELTTTSPLYYESTLLLQVASIPILSPAAVDDPSLVENEPIGTGKYLLQELVPEVSATYIRNPDYWNPDDAGAFGEITLVAMSDNVAALNALKSGQIDAAELDASLAAEAEASGLSVSSGRSSFIPLTITDRLGVNNPPLGDVRVRQALSLAIDRDAIVDEVLRGYGSVSSQPFDPASREYVEGGDDRYAYDPEKARDLLADAGYPDGFTLKLSNFEYTATKYAPIVAQYFSDIGVTVEWVDVLDGTENAALLSNVEVDGGFYLLLYPYAVSGYMTAEGYASQAIQDPEFLDLREKYLGTLDEHDSVLAEAAEYILDQAWLIVIATPDNIWVSDPEFDVSVAGGMRGTVVPRLSWFGLAENGND